MVELVRAGHDYATLSLVIIFLLRLSKGKINRCNGYMSWGTMSYVGEDISALSIVIS